MNPLLKFTIFSLILIVSRSLLIPQQPVAAMDDSAHALLARHGHVQPVAL
jgi:hypothetical protein